jgi:hypothetical protein
MEDGKCKVDNEQLRYIIHLTFTILPISEDPETSTIDCSTAKWRDLLVRFSFAEYSVVLDYVAPDSIGSAQNDGNSSDFYA